MAAKPTEKITEALSQLFEGYFKLKETIENDLDEAPKKIEDDEEDADDEAASDLDIALSSKLKVAFETIIENDDYTPNDIADLISSMTDALQEIAPDVFEESEEDDDDDDYEDDEEYDDEDYEDDEEYDDEDE